ncbi:MAG: Gfo/Idh/MocA family oxidoreductase [Candidatus Omnitrophica bacterium]|nr:Gfo/Idh/MocA family oxidoreductase [Candidatus Omnitrophota bacterium]
MKIENVALIGYGYWGKKIYKYLKESSQFHLAYVFFPSLKKLSPDMIAQTYGPEFTANIDDVWNDKGVSHVIIATPINTHVDVVTEALCHGKNILVEKPLAVIGHEAQSIVEQAKTRGLILETEYTYTYSQGLQAAQNMILQGMIGDVQSISISLKQLGRFLPYDVYLLLGSHALSILDIFLPLENLTFSSDSFLVTEGVPTAAVIHYQSKQNSCRGTIEINLHCPQKDRKVIIYGEKGTIIYAPDQKDVLTLTLYKRTRFSLDKEIIEKQQTFQFDENNNLKNALENFYHVIQRNRPSNSARAVSINTVLDILRPKGDSLSS